MKQTRKAVLIVAFTLLSILGSSGAGIFSMAQISRAAAPPSTMNFQGRLTNPSGNVVADGQYNMQFRIYSVASGGTALWSETRETTNRVQVTNGLFSVQLGAVNPLSASMFDATDLYFEITMATPATATCTTAGCATWESPMTPRNKLATSAYAFNATNAQNAENATNAQNAINAQDSDTLDGMDSTAFASASGSSSYIQNTTSPQTASLNITGTGTIGTVQTANLDTANASTLNIGGTNATSVVVQQDMTIAAGQSISMVGGITSTRPVSPVEGTIYFDSQSKELLVYADTAWQPLNSTSGGDGMAATATVAASNSPQAAKDVADYVVDGTSDQAEINSALVSSQGGRVYLFEGTYTISNRISIPTNTTLVGSGYGTLIQLANFGSTSTNVAAISNTDVSGYSGVAVRDLRLDGRKSINTAGTQHGIDFSGMGQTSGKGALIDNVFISNFRNRSIAIYGGSSNTISNSFFSGNGSGVYFESDKNRITNNTFIDNSIGIDTYASYQNVFADNTIRGGARGINLSASTGNTINSNSIMDTTGSGIYIAGSSSNTLEANKISNSGGSTANNGIYLDNSDFNVISDNSVSDSSSTSTNYAINIANSGSDSNTLSNNQLLSSGSVYNLGTDTIFSSQLDSSGKLIHRSSGGFAVQNTTGGDVLNVSSTSSVLTVSGKALFTAATNSATAVVIQNSTSSALFTADTINNKILIGSVTNGIEFSANGMVLSGTARGTDRLTVSAEYPGLTFRGDGTNNTGNLTSDFCSDPLSINTSACSTGVTTNYYEWTTAETTTQDYDLYFKLRYPDRASQTANGGVTAFTMQGFVTDTATDSVSATVYKGGTTCGTYNIATTNATWTTNSMISAFATCDFAAGEEMIIKINLAAGENSFARVGDIELTYRSQR